LKLFFSTIIAENLFCPKKIFRRKRYSLLKNGVIDLEECLGEKKRLVFYLRSHVVGGTIVKLRLVSFQIPKKHHFSRSNIFVQKLLQTLWSVSCINQT